MSLLRNLAIVGAMGAGAYQYAGPAPAPATPAEFIAVPVAEQRHNVVYVTLAENCPREDAQRAERLAAELERNGVQVVRTNQVNFAVSGDDADAPARITAAMNRRMPIVFVDGKAASNPTAQEIIAALKGGTS